MGNCWPKPVDNLPTTNTRPASPVHKHRKVNNTSPPVDDHGGGGGEVPASGQIVVPDLKMFTFAELKSATRNFRPDTMLGEGGFGRVFKGWIDEKTYAPSKVGMGIPVAVKKSNPDSEQGLKEWQAEVQFLGKFRHPNLVRLLGYCWEEKQFLLVYEYIEKGSLECHLFRKSPGDPISWDTRMKIAIGAASGLAMLHTTEKQVIYRDFKASNILLDRVSCEPKLCFPLNDEIVFRISLPLKLIHALIGFLEDDKSSPQDFNAKLSDFGLAKLGPSNGDSHVTTKVVGTYGYAAPEYMATGHLYVKSDVYGFGVVLLELLMGLRVHDLNRPTGQVNLVDWARPSLPSKTKLRKIMDPRLAGQYPLEGAFQTAALILTCIEPDPKNRPSMELVLTRLEQISTIRPKELKSKPRKDRDSQKHYNNVRTRH